MEPRPILLSTADVALLLAISSASALAPASGGTAHSEGLSGLAELLEQRGSAAPARLAGMDRMGMRGVPVRDRASVDRGLPLGPLLAEYLGAMSQRVGADHVRNTRLTLDRALAEIGAARVGDLTLDAVVEHRGNRMASVSRTTANKDGGALRALLAWAVRTGRIAKNPLQHLRPVPVGERHAQRVRRALSPAEESRLELGSRVLDEQNGPHRVPQTPLLLALLLTGSRWSELVRARWFDVDGNSLRLPGTHTKSGRSRVVPLTRRLLVEMRSLGRSEGLIFRTTTGRPWGSSGNFRRRHLYPAMELAGVPRVNEHGECIDVHALRHTFATRLAEAGVPLSHAQVILGHSDPKITSRVYTHLSAQALEESVAKAFSHHEESHESMSCTTAVRLPSDGVGEGDRTPDLQNHNLALSLTCQWAGCSGKPASAEIAGVGLCPWHEHEFLALAAVLPAQYAEPWTEGALRPYLRSEALEMAGGAS